MTATELLADGDFTNANPVRQVTVVPTPGGHPSRAWFLSPGPDSGQPPAAVTRRGYLRLQASRGTRLRQALAAPQHDVVLRALVRVMSGELLIGAVDGNRPDPNVEVHGDGEWHHIDMTVTGPVDQVVLYAATDATVIDVKQISLIQATPGQTARTTPAESAPAVKQPNATARTTMQAAEMGAVVGPAGRPAALPGGPITVPEPSIAVATLSCPGGDGAEPGAEFTISGTLVTTLVSVTSVTVTCDGLVFPAVVTDDGGGFTVQVRAYRPGSLSVTAVATALSPHQTRLSDSRSAAMPVTLTSSTPTVKFTSVPGLVNLSDTQPTPVPVTVTTADQTQFGPHRVKVSAGLDAPVLTQVSSTEFTGVVQVSQAPFDAKIITATVMCVETATPSDPTVAVAVPVGIATATVGVKDNTPPGLVVTFPHQNVVTAVSSLTDPSATITVTGIATDDQTGVAGVAWAWDPAATAPNPATLGAVTTLGDGEQVAWTAVIPLGESPVKVVDGSLAVPVYFWATDKAGNRAGPQQVDLWLAQVYRPGNLEGRLAQWEYLNDLLSFAGVTDPGQVATPAGTGPTAAEIAAVLAQPVDRLKQPPTEAASALATAPINELRVPIEVLRSHIAQQHIPGPAEKTAYLQAAYESLLAGLGTSYTQLRLARVAADADRRALARQLGIVLAGPAPDTARPDQLDALVLDGPNLTEAALEQLFGLASTQNPDPLAPSVTTPQLPAWQQAGARATWQSEDLHPPVPVAYQALIDPDIVSPDEVKGTTPALAGILTARLADLTAQDTALLTAVSAAAAQAGAKTGDLISAFSAAAAKIINTASTAAAAAGGAAPAGGAANPAGTDLVAVLGGLQQLQQQGQDLTRALAALGLNQPGFSYLLQLQQLAGTVTASDATSFITDQEWADARDVVVAAYRRLKQPLWQQEEITANCLLGPDAFQISGSGPDLGTYRAETTARQDWQRVLAGRIAQDAALSAATDSLLAATERATLPILRDALLDDITTASGGGAPAYAGTPTANWIWNTTGASSGTPVGTIYLRKTFTVADPSSISRAVLRVNADDGHGTYVNGTLVSSAPGNIVNGWQASQVRDIRSLLVPGTNVIAIAGIADTATPSSVIAVAQLDTTRIVTDGTWKAFPGMPASPPPGWHTIGFDDSSWPVAIVQGPYGISPWDNDIQTPSKPDGDLLTRRYEVDMLASGALTTTRAEVAATSVQLLLGDIRAGEVAGDVEPASPAATWSVPSTETFDQGWQVVGSYGAWRSAVTTFLFPEAALNPLSWTSPSAPFQDLLTAVQNGGVLAPDTLNPDPPDPHTVGIAAYQKAVGALLPGGPSFSYEPFSAANQGALADVCLNAARTFPTGPALALLREAFWVVPMLIGGLLTDQGHYADALQWYSLAFPYTHPSNLSSICTQVNQDYKLSAAASPPQLPAPQLNASIWAANLDPFALTTDPDAPRPVPYLRATLLAIISCLRQYADAQFTTGTDESLARAREMYMDARDLASHPAFTVIQPVQPSEPALPIPQLTALQTTVQSQLAKLRQGRNIAGQPRVPVSVDTTTITAASNYTYKTLLARAQQLTTQAQQLEAQLLNALSNLDAKTLQLDQAQQALGLANAQVTTHQAQVTAANDAVTTAQGQLLSTQNVVTSLQTAIRNPINSYEQALLSDYQATRDIQNTMAGVDAAVAVAKSIGSVSFDAPGSFAAASIEVIGAVAKADLQTRLDATQALTQAHQLVASIEDRVQQWQLQLVSAQGSVTAAQNQLQSATDQVATATDDLAVARLQASQAGVTLQALQNQVTSPAMYSWLVQVLGGVYRYFLQQATAVAQLAQAQLAFDRAEPPQTFIRADYWQPPAILVTTATPANTYGLTGAEQLSEDLTTLDGYAFSSDQRSLNISQTFSLSQVMPQEFLGFRSSGQLTFQTPMSWFDADFPGHYLRLIRQVSLTIVALVPPSRGIRATLASNGISTVTTAGPYGFTDVTLQREPGLIAVTATSAATGVFTTDLQPEMLLPFEGNGVATTWSLSLPPAANPFDFSSITDVMLTIDYTALADDGYRDLVVRSLNSNRARSGDCLFSLATSYPDQWYQLANPGPGADPAQPRTATITLRDADFPVNVSGLTTQAITMQLVTAGPDPLPAVTITLGHASQSRIATTDGTGLAGTRRGAADWANITSSPAGDWQITLDAAGGALIDAGTVTDVLLDITWSGQAPLWQ